MPNKFEFVIKDPELSLSSLESSRMRKGKSNAVLFIVILISIILSSSVAATFFIDSEKTDTSAININMQQAEQPETTLYKRVDSDYSELLPRNVTFANRTNFWPVDDVDTGIQIGSVNETKNSDGRYMSVVSEWERREGLSGLPGNADKLMDYNGTLINGSAEGVGEADDGKSIVTFDNIGAVESSSMYHTYRFRGVSAWLWFLALPELREDFPTLEQFADQFNFRSMGARPSYMRELNLTIRLRFADFTSNALPTEYFVQFYNFFLGKWDTYRNETASVLVYAQGIYQNDLLEFDELNFQFEAYFDPSDRMSMLMRVGVKYEYGASGHQELDVDFIEYDFAHESYTIRVDLSQPFNSPGFPTSEWQANPILVVECKSNATFAGEDDVIETWGRGERVPVGFLDVGFFIETIEPMYNEFNSKPSYSLRVFTNEIIRLDIDSLFVTFFPTVFKSSPAKWFYNKSNSDEVIWEINMTLSPVEFNASLNLPDDCEILHITTPFGDNAMDVFNFTNDVLITEQILHAFGPGTYQLIARAPNHITFSSMADLSWDPIINGSRQMPINHLTRLINYDKFPTGRKGTVRVDFLTRVFGSVFYNASFIEIPVDGSKEYRGTTVFPAIAVGVVEIKWVWTNGDSVGFYQDQFVLIGASDAPPFVKIIKPEIDRKVKGGNYLYVAIIAVQPEIVSFSLDGSVDFSDMTKGFLENRGASSSLQDYTWYSVMPVDILGHETDHLISVRAREGINSKITQQNVTFRIDKLAGVEILNVSEPFDDAPTNVNYIFDNDIVMVNVYLDNDKVGTFIRHNINGKLLIPLLRSGTYFLELQGIDDIGNIGYSLQSFFVQQSNPTLWGTIVTWFRDFFKIIITAIIGFFSFLGISVYARKRRERCPFGTKWKKGRCEVGRNF